MQNPFITKQQLRHDVDKWALWMFVCGLAGWLVTFVSKVAFAVVGENITINIRSHLYSNVLQKHMGWHDDSQNAAGVLSAILASDVQMLNGASSEAIAAMAEGLFGLVWGVVIGFYFSWRVALVALALTPLMTIGGAVQAKIDK
jgi:ABC-type multidrug transport system fused ATPase/permease subunit